MLKKSMCAVSMALMLAATCSGRKKVIPEEFTLAARISEVRCQREMKRVRAARFLAYSSQSRLVERAYADTAAGPAPETSRQKGVIYLVTAQIGNKIYSLQGPRLETRTYCARFASATSTRPAGLEILSQDKNGHPRAIWFLIAGEQTAEYLSARGN